MDRGAWWGCKESDVTEQLTHEGWKTDSFLSTDFYLYHQTVKVNEPVLLNKTG